MYDHATVARRGKHDLLVDCTDLPEQYERVFIETARERRRVDDIQTRREGARHALRAAAISDMKTAAACIACLAATYATVLLFH